MPSNDGENLLHAANAPSMFNGFKGFDEFHNYIRVLKNIVHSSFWRLGD